MVSIKEVEENFNQWKRYLAAAKEIESGMETMAGKIRLAEALILEIATEMGMDTKAITQEIQISYNCGYWTITHTTEGEGDAYGGKTLEAAYLRISAEEVPF
jgi:hypothetical protein